MDKDKFAAMLPIITADILDKLMKKYRIDEDTALLDFSKSQLFHLLSDEKTKVWQYSSDMIVELYGGELSGSLVLPEV
jgi:hypothetical protein